MPRWAIISGAVVLAVVALFASFVTLRLNSGRGVAIDFSIRIEPRNPATSSAEVVQESASETPTPAATPNSGESATSGPTEGTASPATTATPTVIPAPLVIVPSQPVQPPAQPIQPVAPPVQLAVNPPLAVVPQQPTTQQVAAVPQQQVSQPVAPTATPVPPTATPTPSPAPPRLAVSPQTLTFAPGESVKTLTINNAGQGVVAWRLTPGQSWLVASPGSGVAPQSVQVQVNRELASAGRQSGILTITSEAGSAIVTVVLQ